MKFVCIANSTLKLLQVVNIKVSFPPGSKEFNAYVELKAKITKVSRSGLVRIQFNQAMNSVSNLTLINNSTLKLRTRAGPNGTYLAYNFTWVAESFIDSTLTLAINFTYPFQIS